MSNAVATTVQHSTPIVADSGVHTVWVVRESWDKVKPMFTRRYEECIAAVRLLLNKGWPVDRLGVQCHDSGRWVSWVA